MNWHKDRGLSPICVDFDGVIHSYKSGWMGPCCIPDDPVPGAFDWLRKMTADGRFEVCIYSSRSKEPGAIQSMKDWMVDSGLEPEVLEKISFPTQKPAANMLVDDRAFCFEGTFPDPEWIVNFKPWNKR